MRTEIEYALISERAEPMNTSRPNAPRDNGAAARRTENGQDRSRNAAILLSSALIVIALLFFGVPYGVQQLFESVMPPTATSLSRDMTPVELKLVSKADDAVLELRVPKAYLTNKRAWRGGVQEFVPMQALLPDMRPRALAEQTPGKSTVRQDLVVITLDAGLWSVPDPAKSMQEGTSYSTRKNDQFGLERYVDEDCTRMVPSADGEIRCALIGYSEVFVYRAGKAGVFFRCERPDIVPDGGCSVRASFRGRVLQYGFARSKLPEWRAVDAAVQKLLNGFVVGDKSPTSN